MANATLGCGHRAQEGGVVVVVDQQAQPCAQVLDFGAVEVTLAAADLVGNLRGAQLLLKDPGLVVGAVEHRKVAELQRSAAAAATAAQALDAGHRAFGLVLFTVALQQANWVAFAQVGPQLLVKDLGVARDHRVGRPQDAAGAAVVLFQRNDLQRGKVLRQTLQVFNGGAAPAVDALVVVAHSGEVLACARQGLEQFVLHGVGVLVLVDQDVVELRLPFGAGFVVALQHHQRQLDQVVEVHGLEGLQPLLVKAHHAGGHPFVVVGGRGIGAVGVQALVLPQADGPLPAAGQRVVGAATGFADDAQHVVAVQDAEVGLQAHLGAVGAQHAHAQRVKGADRQVLCRARPHQGLGAFAHFLRRLVGEGDGGNLLRTQPMLQQPGDLVHDDPGLARAGTGQHQTRPVQVVHRLHLGGVEAGGCGGRVHERWRAADHSQASWLDFGGSPKPADSATRVMLRRS